MGILRAPPRLDPGPIGIRPNERLRTLTDFSRLPESPTPQVTSAEEGPRLQAADKLANGGVGTHKLALDLASRLYRLEGFRKSEVAEHLRKK